ncbi:MAG TPA: hypothetical protein VL651_07700 [Bacteroidia bacterium]|jgi:hypothetical protein|nr:hypothetical protein [Bacteroidia bacterium]
MKRKLLTCTFILVSAFALAQDTIVQGVIRVRRPLEPAKYHVVVQDVYNYSDQNSHITKISSRVIVMSDSTPGVLSAQPYILQSGDSLSGDFSTGALTKYLCANYPKDPFDWNAYFSTLDFGFAWNDSIRSDSAQFIFNIDNKGSATAKALPFKNADSTMRAFEDIVGRRMQLSAYWYPARIQTGKKKKPTKNIASTVMITVYAEDAMAGRLKPLKVIVDQPK